MSKTIVWLFEKPWRFFLLIALIIVIPLIPIAYYGYEANKARVQWCHDHGYKTASVSESRGKISVSTTLCVDDQRRLIIPEEKP